MAFGLGGDVKVLMLVPVSLLWDLSTEEEAAAVFTGSELLPAGGSPDAERLDPNTKAEELEFELPDGVEIALLWDLSVEAQNAVLDVLTEEPLEPNAKGEILRLAIEEGVESSLLSTSEWSAVLRGFPEARLGEGGLTTPELLGSNTDALAHVSSWSSSSSRISHRSTSAFSSADENRLFPPTDSESATPGLHQEPVESCRPDCFGRAFVLLLRDKRAGRLRFSS